MRGINCALLFHRVILPLLVLLISLLLSFIFHYYVIDAFHLPATLFLARISSTVCFSPNCAHSRRYCIFCSSPHVHLGLSLYPSCASGEQLGHFQCEACLTFFHCFHCSLFPARRVSDVQYPL